MFEKNVGGVDRQIRLVVGLVLATVGVVGATTTLVSGTVAVVAFAGAAGALFNALTQRCLMNKLLGIDTCGDAC